jgi:hypothetical protein
LTCLSGLSILYCLSLWIVHYLLPFSLDCPFFIACLSGLSILYCLSLWIVHSLLPLGFSNVCLMNDWSIKTSHQVVLFNRIC